MCSHGANSLQFAILGHCDILDLSGLCTGQHRESTATSCVCSPNCKVSSAFPRQESRNFSREGQNVRTIIQQTDVWEIMEECWLAQRTRITGAEALTGTRRGASMIASQHGAMSSPCKHRIITAYRPQNIESAKPTVYSEEWCSQKVKSWRDPYSHKDALLHGQPLTVLAVSLNKIPPKQNLSQKSPTL